jgi:sec-independent protein translocase protein TatA
MFDGVINPVRIMIIMAVVIVLFGPKRLPEMGQKLGQALRDFKSATSDIRSQIGIDDLAGSVNDIKSSLSLAATERPQPAGAVAPVSPVSAVTGEPPQAAIVSSDKVAESPPPQ